MAFSSKQFPKGTVFLSNGNKYGNVVTIYKGDRYDSAREASYARELDLLLHEKNGKLKEWQRQVDVVLVVNGLKVCSIIVDFLEIYKDGHERWVEIKGKETPDWKLKWRLFDALHPDWDKVVVK